KDQVSHRDLTAQFTRKTVTKKYRAIVYGVMREDSGQIDLPVGTVPNPDCSLMCCKPFAEQTRTAQTLFRVIERFDEYTFVEAQPQTGRQHQIRIHFAEIGHPLLADEFYGPFGILKDGTPMVVPADNASDSGQPAQDMSHTTLSRQTRSRRQATNVSVAELMTSPPSDWTVSLRLTHLEPALPIRRQALHAAELAIEHPITGVPVTFEAPLPEDMQRTLNRLRGHCSSSVSTDDPVPASPHQDGSSQL
ncbi:MAG: RluA family pseudouridine synthase, partial [Planctomycetaceae bacterium]